MVVSIFVEDNHAVLAYWHITWSSGSCHMTHSGHYSIKSECQSPERVRYYSVGITLRVRWRLDIYLPCTILHDILLRQWPVDNQGRGRFLSIDEIIFSRQNWCEITFFRNMTRVWCFRRMILLFLVKIGTILFLSKKSYPPDCQLVAA